MALVGSSCALALVVGLAVGTRLERSAQARSEPSLPIFYPKIVEVTVDPVGRTRGERVIEAVLEGAPACTPTLASGEAPTSERREFMAATVQKVHTAQAMQGFLNVEWRVVRKGDRLFGALYSEDCR